MPKPYLFILLFCFIADKSFAQSPFSTSDSVDINNINARILVHGDMSWDPVSQIAACEFPKGSGKHINFASSLWMSGYDAGGQLHIAAQTYRQHGNDYWPGPLGVSDTLSYATSQDWAKIWKVSRNDISNFLSLSTHTIANTPQTILNWPAKGNTHAAGNSGASLTITTDMAPFIDLNGNGTYEPLAGEYPDIKGDQALWWVFSDKGSTHNETNGRPLGVEVQSMAYAYNRGTLIDNVVYYDYKIINRSTNSYSGMRIGLWDDVDLGYYNDDYIGYDSTHRMGVAYNGTSDDGLLASPSHPHNSYGKNIPVVGMTMIVAPGDVGTSYAPAGSFINYTNGYDPPTVDTEYNNYLHAKSKDGRHYIHDTTDIDFMGIPSGPDVDFVFTGDPGDTNQWSECSKRDNPGDRRFILTTGDFSLSAGGSQHFVLALVTTDPDTMNGCGSVTFDSIKIVADTAWAVYHNPPPPNSVNNIELAAAISIYPNPAHDLPYIEHVYEPQNEAFITVYNSIGQTIAVAIDKAQTKDKIDISKLVPGAYYLLYRSGNIQRGMSFIKN